MEYFRLISVIFMCFMLINTKNHEEREGTEEERKPQWKYSKKYPGRLVFPPGFHLTIIFIPGSNT
jgi:hypothetical protein